MGLLSMSFGRQKTEWLVWGPRASPTVHIASPSSFSWFVHFTLSAGSTMYCVPLLIPRVPSGFRGRGIPIGPFTTKPSLHAVNLRLKGTPHALFIRVNNPVWDDGCLDCVDSTVVHNQGSSLRLIDCTIYT